MANKVNSFLSETRQELKRVTWPSQQELMGATGVVILTTFLMAAFVGAVDAVLSVVLRLIFQ